MRVRDLSPALRGTSWPALRIALRRGAHPESNPGDRSSYLAVTAEPLSSLDAVRYGAAPMAGYFALFGLGAALVLAPAVASGWWRSGLGGRALSHLGTLATLIAASVTAALVAVAFLGERLAGAPNVAAFFAWGDLLFGTTLMVVMLFAATAGLIAGCATLLPPAGCGGWWRESAGRCLVCGAVAAAVLPVLVVHVIFTSAEAARLAARCAC